MQLVSIELVGVSPLMQSRMPKDELIALLAPKTKKKKDINEERTPRMLAEKHAYQRTDGTCFVPAEYISSSFAYVASDYKQTGSTRRSLRSVAKGAFRPQDPEIDLLDDKGKPITNFEVDVRRGCNRNAGNAAVPLCRPRYDKWRLRFTVQIDEALISLPTAQEILADAGKRAGIGAYRVSSGGYYGQFRISKFDRCKE